MKVKIFTSVLLISIALFYSFKHLEKPLPVGISTNPPQPLFLVGAMHDATDYNTQYISNVLGLNVYHKYCAPTSGWYDTLGNLISSDTVGGPTSIYGPKIRDRISSNEQKGLMTLLDRPITSYMAFGQRSDYQCEESIKVDPNYKFYSYNQSIDNNSTINDIMDSSQHGNLQWVKRCLYTSSNPGTNSDTIVKGLKANREQVNVFWGGGYLVGDSTFDWFVMPRIRIDSVFANNPSNQNVEVCKIITSNWDGDKKEQILKVRNFKINDDSTYRGNYLSEYYSRPGDLITNLNIPHGRWFNRDSTRDPFGGLGNKVDFKVYWYDKCDMWIDYIRVENELAHNILTLNNATLLSQLEYEVEDIAMEMINSGDPNSPYKPYKFYIEEFEFNHLPSIGFVNKKIIDLSAGRLSLMVNYNYDLVRAFLTRDRNAYFSAQQIKTYLIDSAKIKEIFTHSYGLQGWLSNDPVGGNGNQSYNPPTFTYSGDYNKDSGRLVYKASTIEQYETWLQNTMDANYIGTNAYSFMYKLSDTISRIANVPYLHLFQAHSWWYKYHKLKEPTNEELRLMTNLTVSYGAKGIMYFSYNSHNQFTDAQSWSRGIAEPNNTPRYYNAYNQPKWQEIININEKLNILGPYLMKFDDENRRSFIYRNATERNEMSANTFIDKLKAYPALEFAPDPIPDLSNVAPETNTDAYLQAAFFQKENETVDKSKYFMIVNKRCSPFINYTSANSIGGRRLITIKINPAYLPGFNNWKIFDLETGDSVRTISKNDTNYFFLADFMPGEGKLFRIAPVMQEGGTLVTDEECGGEFDCKGEVNNNGKSVTINPGTTINFANTSARIIMNGGEFRSGVNTTEETDPVYLKGKDGNFWKGLNLNECGGVEMFTTYFENISPYPVDSTYAATMIDCGYINIGRCIFHADLDIKTGGILIYYTSELRTKEVFVTYNQFIMDAGDMPALSIMTAGYITFPLILENNEFESYSGNSSNAIFLSGVVGGAIKENQIVGYKKGITMIWSSMDIYGNKFDGGDADSKGVLSYASSNANLAPDGSTYTGGLNTISVEGENAKCIDVDNSFLLLNSGYNTFDIKNYESGDAFHLSGAITDEAYADPLDATLNCFKVSGIDTDAVHNMTWTSTDPVNYNFLEYYCGDNEQVGMIAFNLGNGNFDTLLTEFSGSGGGVSNSHLSILNEENVEIISAENLEDSVSINIRKRDYERVSELCFKLLDEYMDSIESSVIVQKLYLAELRLDSIGNRVSNLKSYFEMLILNNPEKELLVKQSFYLIQKCKVALGQYESAMEGFEQIINQNPFSYEGLVASWDYAATSLLDILHGSGGAVSSYEVQVTNDHLNNYYTNNDDPRDKYDIKPFTKENRNTIRVNVFNSFRASREKESEIIKTLETKVAEGKATKSEKNELQTKRILSEIVKTKEPADISEHIKNVNANIQVLFGSARGNTSEKEIKSIIPTEYNISQNYPNPFNPVTKINFDLPQEGKVKLIVYDLLGREIVKLVNNELRATGRHLVEFNGHNLSSGVYFYRLEVNDFVQTRRMILIK